MYSSTTLVLIKYFQSFEFSIAISYMLYSLKETPYHTPYWLQRDIFFTFALYMTVAQNAFMSHKAQLGGCS